jgi:hypothetical protein
MQEESLEEIDAVFKELRDKLAEKPPNVDTLKSLVATLITTARPQTLMNQLASFLFKCSADSNHSALLLTSSEALTILGVVVSADATFLKPAAKAVRDEALRLSTTTTATIDGPMSMTVSSELLQVMVAQLCGPDVQVSTNATQALVACCQTLGSSVADATLQSIADAWTTACNNVPMKREATTICVTCASAIVQIVSLKDAFVTAGIACGALNAIQTMLCDDSDPLLQMTVLDLIQQLACVQPMHPARASWLFSEGILTPLLKIAGGTEQPSDLILGGAALRVVASLCKLAHRQSDSMSRTALNGFHRALHCFESTGELDRLALIDAISSFASASPDALQLVLDDPVTRNAWLSLSVAQPKLKSAIVYSVSLALDPPPEVDANGDSIPVKFLSNEDAMMLFSMLGKSNNQDPAKLVIALAKSPLPEVRLGAYALLRAVAKLETGGQLLFTEPGFFEFLMNRDNERILEGKEAKFAVVEAVVNSPVKGLLAQDIVRQLERYLQQGPQYIKAMTWELATAE